MISPTKKQSLDRWDTLPLNLREELCLEVNSDFVWKTCNDEHIPDEKIYEVAKVIGYVLFGFLHPEDVAQEIKERLGVDTRTANSIEEAVNKRIFAPLRTDIDKVYSPLSKLEESSSTPAPKMLQNTEAPLKSIQKPTVLSDVGWSKTSSAGLGATAAPASQRPTLTPAPATTTPVAAPSIPTIPAVPATPQTPAEPAPVMLHEDTTFKPAARNEGFTLPKSDASAEEHFGAAPQKAPIKPAFLEFSGPSASTTKPVASGTYQGEFKSSLSSTPVASAGPRTISQVAPAAAPIPATTATPPPLPRPPMPPKPFAAPISTVPVPHAPQAATAQPSQPPAPPQKDKPIVKDFL